MKVSIVICTRNRANDLRDTLDAISRVAVDPGCPTELVIVDNNSSDATEDVVRTSKIQSMNIRYVREPQVGLSNARNRGLRESSGDVILFTDDDVRPPRHWVTEMSRPVLDGLADAVVGAVHLAPHLERPWLKGALRVAVACTLDQEGLEVPTHLVGANMAIGRHVFSRVSEFEPKLGAGAMGFGEETLFSYQVLAAGYRIAQRWDVVVEHFFDEGRLDAESFRQIAERMGRSRAYMTYHWEGRRVRNPRLLGCITVVKLRVRKLFNRLWCTSPEISEWEFAYIARIAFARQYMIEERQHGGCPESRPVNIS